MAKHSTSSNKDRVYRDAAAHHLGVGKHTFLTEKDWKKAGFCLIPGAKASGSCKVWDLVPRFHKVCEVVRKYYCDDQVLPIESEEAKPFFKEERIGNDTVMFYDENEYAGFKWAKDKAWELFHEAEKQAVDDVRELFMAAAKKYSDLAKMYAGC